MQALITARLVSSLKPSDKPYEVRDNSLKGLILRVQPSGVMSYVCEYGRGKRITIGSAALITPALARTKAREILGRAARGDDPQKAKALTRQREAMPTLRGYIEGDYSEWAKTHRKTGARTRGGWR